MGFQENLVVNYIRRIPAQDRERKLAVLVREFPDEWLTLVDRVLHNEQTRRKPLKAAPFSSVQRNGFLNVRMP